MNRLEQLKERAEYFPRGHIIPRRIGKCSKRKYQHLFRFGADTWAVPTPTGYICFAHATSDNSAIQITACAPGDVNFKGSPYHKNGRTQWVQDHGISNEQFERNVLSWCYPTL